MCKMTHKLQLTGIYPISFTNGLFPTKIGFLNIVKCSWGSEGALSSKMSS